MIEKQQSGEYQPPLDDALLPDLCRGEVLFSVVIIAELMALLITLASNGVRNFDWMLFAAASMIALWITLLSALILCLGKERINRLGSKKAAAVSYGVIVLVAIGCGIGAEFSMQLLGNASQEEAFSAWHILDYFLLTAIPAGILLRYVYLQQKLRIQQRSELDARIEALQSRIRPHFLFNSMNVIASLISTDPVKAEQAVEDISDLFRSALSGSEVLVPLRDELSLCRRYLALEKLRLGDRLATRWEIGDYGDNVKVPPLSLQPLIENAIYHGIQLLPEGGEISVSISKGVDSVQVVVTNPLGRMEQQRKGNRMAIQNIRYRLTAHFGDKASIDAKPEGDMFVTQITVPSSW